MFALLNNHSNQSVRFTRYVKCFRRTYFPRSSLLCAEYYIILVQEHANLPLYLPLHHYHHFSDNLNHHHLILHHHMWHTDSCMGCYLTLLTLWGSHLEISNCSQLILKQYNSHLPLWHKLQKTNAKTRARLDTSFQCHLIEKHCHKFMTEELNVNKQRPSLNT